MAVFKQGPRPEDHYTMVANALARDPMLALRTKGVYLFMRSHRDGWHMTVERIAKALGVSKDTVAKSIKELEEAGYIRRAQAQGKDGKFSSIEYMILSQPHPEKPDTVKPATDLPDTVLPDTENQPTKEDYSFKKINLEEDHQEPPNPQRGSELAIPDRFAEFYDTYPRRVGKIAAQKAWAKATKKVDPQTVIDGAAKYAAWCKSTKQETRFIAHPSTWLNRGSWDDELAVEQKPSRNPYLAALKDGTFG